MGEWNNASQISWNKVVLGGCTAPKGSSWQPHIRNKKTSSLAWHSTSHTIELYFNMHIFHPKPTKHHQACFQVVTSLSSISRAKFWPKARTNKISKLWYLLRPNDQLWQDRAPKIPAWFCGKVHLLEMQPYIDEVDTFVQIHFLSRAISIFQICNLFEFCCGFHWSSVIYVLFYSMAKSHQQESIWCFLTTHLKNMLVKMGSSSSNRVEHKKHLSCHHPGIVQNAPPFWQQLSVPW